MFDATTFVSAENQRKIGQALHEGAQTVFEIREITKLSKFALSCTLISMIENRIISAVKVRNDIRFYLVQQQNSEADWSENI